METELLQNLKDAVATRERPMFTTALIAGIQLDPKLPNSRSFFALLSKYVTSFLLTSSHFLGDAVILDAIARADLLSKIPVVFVDTFTLFPESIAHMREVEQHYGFKAITYHAEGCVDQNDYYEKYGRDYWMKDIDKYVSPSSILLSTVNAVNYSIFYVGHALQSGAHEPRVEGAEL